MDELEISGKRYISTRRAAKEHKYSPDYIGQLIRAKKVIGQKVGRSWYVEEKSLTNYFDGEKSGSSVVSSEEKVEKKEEVFEIEKREPVVAHISINDGDAKEEKILKPASDGKERISSSHYIPINVKNKKGLTYITDDAPRLPSIEKKHRTPVPQKNIVHEIIVQEENIFQEESVPAAKSYSALKISALVGVGIFVFVAVAATSASIGTVTTVKEGSPASVEFSLP